MDDNPKTILWNYHPTQVHLCLPMNRLGRGKRINALPSCRRGSRTRRAGGGGLFDILADGVAAYTGEGGVEGGV